MRPASACWPPPSGPAALLFSPTGRTPSPMIVPGRRRSSQCRLAGWFFVRAAPLVTRVDDRWFAVAGPAAVQLEQRGRGHQVAELGVAIVARVEVRALFG